MHSRSEFALGQRVMRSQTVAGAGLTEDQVVAVLRGLADHYLWQGAFRVIDNRTDLATYAARYCHAIADDIIDQRTYRSSHE